MFVLRQLMEELTANKCFPGWPYQMNLIQPEDT